MRIAETEIEWDCRFKAANPSYKFETTALHNLCNVRDDAFQKFLFNLSFLHYFLPRKNFIFFSSRNVKFIFYILYILHVKVENIIMISGTVIKL